MANRVVQLNENEVKLWNVGFYCKSLTRVKNPYYEGDLCEIRNSNRDKIGYAKVLKVEKVQTALVIKLEDYTQYMAFEANMPIAPIVTMLSFELLDKWEGQE